MVDVESKRVDRHLHGQHKLHQNSEDGSAGMRCHFSHTMVCPIWSYITDTEHYLLVAVRERSTNNNTPSFEILPTLRDSILNGAPWYRRVEWPLQAYSNSIGPMHLLQHNSRHPQNSLSIERLSLMIQAHHHGSLHTSLLATD
jgi:hypothetical protein